MRNIFRKNCFLFSIIFSLLFVSVLFPSCKLENGDIASVTINLGGGGSARAISDEEKSAAIFNVYFNGEPVGTNVSGNFSAVYTVGQNLTVRVEAFVNGRRIASGESNLTVTAEQNIVNIVLMEDREVTPSSPPSQPGSGGDSPSQPGDVPPSQPGGGGEGSSPDSDSPAGAPKVTIGDFNTQTILVQGQSGVSSLNIGVTAGISIDSVNPNTLEFDDGNTLPTLQGTFSGTYNDANFIGWLPNDNLSGTPTQNASAELNGKTLIPVMALNANSGAKYVVNNLGYDTFDNAWNAANNTSNALMLRQNSTLNQTKSVSGNITVDLNGYSLTSASGSQAFVVTSGSSLTVKNDSRNTSNVIGNGTVSGNGGIIQINGGSVTLENVTLTGGNVEDTNGNQQVGKGGAVYINGGSLTMNSAKILGCTAALVGGAVCVEGGGTFNMNSGSFIGDSGTSDGNSCEGRGGGVAVEDGTFNMTGNCKILNNMSMTYGGGVSVNGSNAIFNMRADGNGVPTISDNDADTYAGGVHVASGTFNMYEGTISENYAVSSSSDSGSDVYIVHGANYTNQNGNIDDLKNEN